MPVIWLLSCSYREEVALSRAGHVLDPEEVYETLDALDSVVIGDVETYRRKLRGYASLGVDRLMCLMQFGALPHERVLASLRLAGEALVPEFSE